MKLQDEQNTKWNAIPLLYAYVFQYVINKIIGNKQINQEVTSRTILEIWHRHVYHLPRVFDYYILKELEEYGLIYKVCSSKYLIQGELTKGLITRLNQGVADGGDPPCVYLYFFGRVKNIIGPNNKVVSSTQILGILRKYIPNVARVYDSFILEELCKFGFLRKLNTQKYVFLGAGFNNFRKYKDSYLWFTK